MSNYRTLHKGEWSELYAFLKILNEGFLFECDSKLNKFLSEKIKVLNAKLIQSQTQAVLVYEKKDDLVLVRCNGLLIKEVNISDFEKKAQEVLSKIRSEKNTFVIEEVSGFLKNVGDPVIKSTVSKKRDLTLTVYDPLTQKTPEYGFSVKSNLEGNSTLLNASSGTNFIFKVETDTLFFPLKAKVLLQTLSEENIKISYVSVASKIYNNNLQRIDTKLPEILSYMLLSYFSKKATAVKDLLDILKKENPLNYDDITLYENKIGDFLIATAVGMVPHSAYNDVADVDGGLIVVKNDGDIVSFLLFKRNHLTEFRRYLIEKTFFDTPSTTRHKFGFLYSENSQTYLKLNLQIRFS